MEAEMVAVGSRPEAKEAAGVFLTTNPILKGAAKEAAVTEAPPATGEGLDDDAPNMGALRAYVDSHHPRVRLNGVMRHHAMSTPTGRYAWCCCRCGCDSSKPSAFLAYGPGVSHYFKFVKAMTWIMFYLFIIALPQLLMNMAGSSGDIPLSPIALADLRLSATTLGNLAANGTDVELRAAGSTYVVSHDIVAQVYSYSYLFGVLVFMQFLRMVGAKALRDSDDLLATHVALDRYTVQVTSIPGDTEAAQLREFFESVTGSKTADAVVLEDVRSVLPFFQARARVLNQIRVLRSKLRALEDPPPGAPHPKTSKESLTKDLEAKVNKVKAMQREHSTTHSGQRRAVMGFVTFTTVDGARSALRMYSGSSQFLHWACQSRKKRFRQHRIKVVAAVRPSSIIHEHLGFSACSRFGRALMTLCASLALLALSGVALYFTRRFQNDAVEDGESGDALTSNCAGVLPERIVNGTCFCAAVPANQVRNIDDCSSFISSRVTAVFIGILASTVVVLVNMALRRVIMALAKFERHPTTDEQEGTLFIKLLVRQFVNTAVLTVLINSDLGRITDAIGLGDAASDVSLSDSVPWDFNSSFYDNIGTSLMVTVALSIVGVNLRAGGTARLFLYKQERSKRLARTQHALLKSHTGPAYRLAPRLARLVNVLVVCVMFSPGMPLLFMIGAVYCLVAFWMDKSLLIYYYRTPPAHSMDLANRALNILWMTIPLSLGLATLMYSSDVLQSGESPLKDRLSGTVDNNSLDDILNRFGSTHVIPVLIAFLIAVLVIALTQISCIAGTLTRFLTCQCFRARANMHQADQVALRDIPLADLVGTSRLADCVSYDIVDNKTYTTMLSLSPEERDSARRHGLMFTSMYFTPDP